ncbi:MAG: phosphotransferase [Nitrospirales bacterium]|nr:phosphotransferase [Nitrospirales bacterium]
MNSSLASQITPKKYWGNGEMKSHQSVVYQYIKMPNVEKHYFCLQQNILVLAWVLFFKKNSLSPVVRPEQDMDFSPKAFVRQMRSYLGLIRSNLRILIVFIIYKYHRGTGDEVVELPRYGQVCLHVHKGYKIFDFYRNSVIKVFDQDIDPSVIQEEIDLLQQISKFDFAPSLRKWNGGERWYEEELLQGSLDASYTKTLMDSEIVLPKFHDHVLQRLKTLILFQEPKSINAVTYLADMTKILPDSRLATQESTVQEFKITANFVDWIVGQFRREGDHQIFLVFTHGDLVPANMLNTKRGMKIIDWEGAGYRSVLFDFYSYFFNQVSLREVPVNVLVAEIEGGLPMCISELAQHTFEISRSLLTLEKFYRWTFYIEMICRLVDRARTDKNLPIMKYLGNYTNAFIRYEEFFSQKDESN